MKTILKPVSILLCGALTACSGNPLEKKPTNVTARLLTMSSEIAMQRLHPDETHGMGDRYRLCMEHRAPQRFDCDALYKKMAEVMTEKGMKARARDIKDDKLYSACKESLEQLSYFTL